MIQEEEPFTGRLLAGFFNREGESDAKLTLKACSSCKASVEQNLSIYLQRCLRCNSTAFYHNMPVVAIVLPSK